MTEALRLAEQGLYTTTPNPRVGCVIIQNDNVVGCGWHAKAGEPHAEIYALRDAGARAKGATVYVTLEPCSHFGHTPPCATALIEAGVSRVIIAMKDPNPAIDGGGISQLQQAGIVVQTGLLAAEAEALNIGFVTRMRTGRPWVRTKIAASLDGRTALKNGQSQWITGEAARRDGHRWRARSCAVLTGIGSVRDDDPQLTVRHVETSRQPLCVVVDSRLAIPLSAKLLQEAERTWIFTAQPDTEKQRQLIAIGAQVTVLPEKNGGRVDLAAMLKELGKAGINELLVESGAVLNGAFIAAGLVDEMILYLAPTLLGDTARGMLAVLELTTLADKYSMQLQDVRKVGQDIRLLTHFLPKQ